MATPNPYVLYITFYQLNITNYDLHLTLYPLTLTLGYIWGVFVLRRKIIKMNKYYDPKLSQVTLETYQGYSLQVFTSGRIKLFYHITHRHRNEHYALRPNRFREAYAKQHQRSQQEYPEHFALVSDILASSCENRRTLSHRLFRYWSKNTYETEVG